MNSNQHIRNSERRKKRLLIPYFYFILEVISMWLVLALIQLEFYFQNWSLWAIIILILGIGYSIAKTVHVLRRQKDYDS